MTNVAIIIPWRDRGNDPHRAANMTITTHWYGQLGYRSIIVNDGRTGDQQFNRHASYNCGTRSTDADILCYIEADTLIPNDQLLAAIRAAAQQPRLVVPFESLHHLSERDTIALRSHISHGAEPQHYEPVEKTPHQRNAGAANIISRAALEMAGGWDEGFEGHWYDDDAMKIRFERATGNPTHYIPGNAYHLYHLSASKGEHLSAADRAATARNKKRLRQYQQGRQR